MLKIPANIAVITSVNDDHIDHYGTLDNIKDAFSQFVNRADFAILPDSVGINCDAGNFITFGFEDVSPSVIQSSFVIQVRDTGIQKKISVTLCKSE